HRASRVRTAPPKGDACLRVATARPPRHEAPSIGSVMITSVTSDDPSRRTIFGAERKHLVPVRENRIVGPILEDSKPEQKGSSNHCRGRELRTGSGRVRPTGTRAW